MFTKAHSKIPGCVHVTFQLPASIWAVQIFLTGDFNQWDNERTPFVQMRNGEWRVEIDLPVDHSYAFCYWLDGRRLSEFYADGFVKGTQGEENSVIYTSLNH